MSSVLATALEAEPDAGATPREPAELEGGGTGKRPAAAPAACFHCGLPCPDSAPVRGERVFCCQGCLFVHDLLAENGLAQFYELGCHPGATVGAGRSKTNWSYLDEPALQQRLLDFTDGKVSRVTFQVPAIHCIACVWLLENLFRLNPAIGKSVVNFPRREIAVSYATQELPLSELAGLLASLGYPPRLTLGELEERTPDGARAKRWLQLGVAGFAFGNIMLFSLPAYLGFDSFSAGLFRTLFGCLSLALAAPVLLYSASDYWRSGLVAIRQRVVTLDVPIVLGLAVLYTWSGFEIISGRGGGYLDSLTGLVFLLLCGRAFQQKTYQGMLFERDYKSFFPLSVVRKTAAGEETVALSSLRVGDRLMLRHGELLPADARLLSGSALVDYSFVTGEAEPVSRQAGDYLYAGGKQAGGAIEVEVVKPVSQSYLTSLWNHEAFAKNAVEDLDTLTNHYSRWFIRAVILVECGAALYWVADGQSARSLKAFTSVLIVACPCALALAAPFALGTSQRLLARCEIFLKNTLVLERLARVDAIVFDKTGTLTAAQAGAVAFFGADGGLSPQEKTWVAELAKHSTHPLASKIRQWVENTAERGCVSRSGSDLAAAAEVANGEGRPGPDLKEFVEVPGGGISGLIDGRRVRLGSRAWLERLRIEIPNLNLAPGSTVFLSVNGAARGAFVLTHALQPEVAQLLETLGAEYDLALLSGDNERERERFRGLFGPQATLQFNQSPLQKLGFVRALQQAGKTVMMVGDGLNDAGALKQSDVGIAVVEKVGAFSPASDVILPAARVPRLLGLLRAARRSVAVVRWSLAISAVYNVAGVSIAAAGVLSPLICAVLMPLSSISVVLFACGAARWAVHQERFQ